MVVFDGIGADFTCIHLVWNLQKAIKALQEKKTSADATSRTNIPRARASEQRKGTIFINPIRGGNGVNSRGICHMHLVSRGNYNSCIRNS